MRVLRHESAPGAFTVDLLCQDLQTIFSSAGTMPDRDELPPFWPGDTVDNPAPLSGFYLADRNTGFLSDGVTPGKRLR